MTFSETPAQHIEGRFSDRLESLLRCLRTMYIIAQKLSGNSDYKGSILQLRELITHTTLCYIQSGLSEHSPPNVKQLWNIKTQNRTDLRDKGIILDFPVCGKHSINQVPLVAHAKLWNNQGKEKYVKELKPNTYKAQSKQSLLGS